MGALRKAAEQALEALEVPLHTPTARKQAWDAINALRAELAEQEQEPVADDALRLADALIGRNGVESVEMVAAATLRRQHAEIADLRAEVERLRAVAEQEPVAWRWKAMVNGDFVSNWVLTHSEPPPYALESQPLYTHPPRREQDDAEIVSLRAEVERLRAVAEQQPVADDALRLADGNAEMEDMLRIQHAIILELRAEVERLAQDYVRACKLVAGMHAAATGRPGEGTRLGVVEDVAAVREEVERLREALEHLIERAATSDDCQYGTLSTSYVRDIARAALARKETT